MFEKVREVSGCNELYEVVRTYRGYRDRPDGEMPFTTMEVLHDRHSGRWVIKAEDEDGRRATGNPEPSLDVALATTHWSALDG